MSTRGGMHYSRLGHVDYFKHTTHTARCATFISRSAALKYRFLLRPLNAVWGASSFNPAMAVSFSTIKAARLPAGRTSAYLQKNHGVDPIIWFGCGSALHRSHFFMRRTFVAVGLQRLVFLRTLHYYRVYSMRSFRARKPFVAGQSHVYACLILY